MINRMKRSGVGYVIPALLVVAVVMLYPLINILVMGFFNNTLFMDVPEFCGLDQYKKIFSDRVFIDSIKNTAIWTFGSVVFQFGLGFALALVLGFCSVGFWGHFWGFLGVFWAFWGS